MINIHTIKPGDYVKCVDINTRLSGIRNRTDYVKLRLNKVYRVIGVDKAFCIIYIQYDDLVVGSWAVNRFVKANQPILYKEEL